MKTGLDSVIHSELRQSDQDYQLLYFPYNGLYEWIFHNPGIRCYSDLESIVYQWQCGIFPSSQNQLSYGLTNIPQRIDLDAVVCNHRHEQVFKAQQLADYYHLPLIIIDHEIPIRNAKTNIRKYVNSRMPKKAIHVIPEPFVQEEWIMEDSDRIVHIPYGIKTVPIELKTKDIVVVGDYNNQDHGLLQGMLSCHAKAKGYGYNNNLTKPYENFPNLLKILRSSRIVVIGNSAVTPPLLTMLAMSCGALVITNKTRWTEKLITHEKNGLLFNSIKELRNLAKKFVADSDTASEIALNGRLHVLEKYNYQKFINNWQNLLNQVSKQVYIR